MHKSELFNTLTHVVGTFAALIGLVVLVTVAALKGDPWKITTFSIYGATLVLLYIFSSFYHGLKGDLKKIFRMLDHSAIYFLIAGTYTPLGLIILQGTWRWFIFCSVWGLAMIGIVIEALHKNGRRVLPIIIYILMGWLILIALDPLLRTLPTAGFFWLLAGGLLYTGGLIFYAWEKKLWYAHGLWHLCVLGGSICHYVTVIVYIA